jgi:glycosyltransferase involved in cell wall biosynthesis
MTDNRLISCIVPVFNGERYLAETLDSILGQSYRPLEVILVDDGSTDGTAAVAERYGEHVTYMRQDNAGPAVARNVGLGAATGEFISFLDADDLWHATKLSRQMERFRAQPEIDLSLVHMRAFKSPELATQEPSFHDPRIAEVHPGTVTVALLGRKTAVRTVGAFDVSLLFAEDQDWYVRAVDLGLVIDLIPDVLVDRRIHPYSLTRQKPGDTHQDLLRMVKRNLDRRRDIQTESNAQATSVAPSAGRGPPEGKLWKK